MADPNLADFYGRVKRIEKARAKGFGFEAAGTLGRSYYMRKARKRLPVLRSLMVVMACGFGLKGAIYYQVGGGVYDQRVESLMQGEGFDRLGGALMQADPVTLFISEKIGAAVTSVDT
ncbi:hypothetical protein [Rhodobacter ferrooxidans]|uniref:Uncharacterized protein n=1 Tax=Rhodobacter ferrooxidans TaxID=371731 RepID=C8S3K5_9RHOB|nr:hypothetical protein [Rhodobacter sp. SW2]EEW24453.1 conserved hypothetical protein [Rhodobacter sp. SW2]